MKWIKIAIILAIALGAALLLISSTNLGHTTGEPWEVPESYQKMKNPIASTEESLDLGESLYMQHCKSCHGKEGLGDGSKAEQLDTPCGDFTEEEFQEQTDGSIFYKIREGRDDMPSFAKKIPDEEEVWSIINFVRTLE